MTTDFDSHDEGPCFEHGALDPFKDLRQMLPKLAIPSWVRLIGKQLDTRRAKAVKPSKPAQRAMRRNERRLLRALSGDHTRARKVA